MSAASFDGAVAPACPLLVVGFPRSGTTLTQVVLDAHPDVALRQDKGLIQGMWAAGMRPDTVLHRSQRPRVLLEMARINICRRHLASLEPGLLAGFLTDERDLSFADVYERLLDPSRAVPVWGEKSVANAFYVAELGMIYPRCGLVHVVRDPRAAILSLYRKRHAGSRAGDPRLDGETVSFFALHAMRWRAWVQAVQEADQRLGGGRVHEIRYERLVTDAEAEVARLCAALGLQFEPRMLDTAQWRPELHPEGTGRVAHRKLSEEIDPTRALAAEAVADWARYTVETTVGAELTTFGYRPGPVPGRSARLRVERILRRERPAVIAALDRELGRRRGVSGDPSGDLDGSAARVSGR